MAIDITALSVLIKCEAFLPRFFENLRTFEAPERTELLLFVLPHDVERIDAWVDSHLRAFEVRRLVVEQDPGLYGLWNQGATLARGRYLTNLNPDDLRAPWHIRRCVDWLDGHPDFGLVCGQIAYGDNLNDRWHGGWQAPDWLAPLRGEFRAENLFTLDRVTGRPLSSKNIPHCMPVWRRSVHDRAGWFDEARYGPSADWAFWLHAMEQGLRGWLIPEVMGLFHRNPESYWQVHGRGESFDRRILRRYEHLLDLSTPLASPDERATRLARANRCMACGDALLAMHAYAHLVDEDPCFGPFWSNLHLASRRVGDLNMLRERWAKHRHRPGVSLDWMPGLKLA